MTYCVKEHVVDCKGIIILSRVNEYGLHTLAKAREKAAFLNKKNREEYGDNELNEGYHYEYVGVPCLED